MILQNIVLGCWPQRSSRRGSILEAEAPPPWFLHYHSQCLPSLHPETDQRSWLPRKSEASPVEGCHGVEETSCGTREAEPNQRICPRLRRHPNPDHERNSCGHAEHWLKSTSFTCKPYISYICIHLLWVLIFNILKMKLWLLYRMHVFYV